MAQTFIIEDEFHADIQGEFATFDDAIAELKRRQNIPWNKEPNVAPCTAHETCGIRDYEIIQYDTESDPWKELKRTMVLKISSTETKWLLED